MAEIDVSCMEQAIDWATGCKPISEHIPLVGAIIAVNGEIIGYGRRGTGRTGDDDHAEHNAISRVSDKSLLSQATLYTTLEPCTRDVRSNPLTCCSELIRQHHIQKVFVGILDPNQGVTGKGIWSLQEQGIDVSLFPHALAERIRALNAAFIRAQKTLGATVLSPSNGEELKTYLTNGRHAVRLKCLNAPSHDSYLLIFHNGQCWPQSSQFRPAGDGIWEVDAHFGSVGHHTLYVVTASDLGKNLIDYYRKIVNLNLQRREKLKGQIEDQHLSLLGGDYPGIQMNALPKGFRLEASVDVMVVPKN